MSFWTSRTSKGFHRHLRALVSFGKNGKRWGSLRVDNLLRRCFDIYCGDHFTVSICRISL